MEVLQIGDGVFRLNSRSNAGWVVTSEGVVLVDSANNSRDLVEALRRVTCLPVRYVIYTHGHEDHTFTASRYKEVSSPETRVIAHALLPKRLLKYQLLGPRIDALRRVQLGLKAGPPRDRDRKFPDIVYHHEYQFELGGSEFLLLHGRGETDDASVIYIRDKNVVFTGDFLIGSWPNLGNPYKVPRYCCDWYEMLDHIREMDPSALVPGHGRQPLVDKVEIHECLKVTSEALRYVHDEVVRRLNAGQTLQQMVREVRLPAVLENSVYLAQTYSRVELAVMAVHRGYTGWFDWDPSDIYPIPRRNVAHYVRSLIGDDNAIINMAKRLWGSAEHAAAFEVLQLILRDEPNHEQGRELRLEFMRKLSSEDMCQMTRGAWEYFAKRDQIALRKRAPID